MQSAPVSIAKPNWAPVRSRRRLTNLTLILVWAVGVLVHCPPPVSGNEEPALALPAHVVEMRDLILSAARSGNVEDLKTAIEWNEMRPDLGAANSADPIQSLMSASGDANGRDILAAITEILEMPPAALPLGKDLENNMIYVWPYLAEKPLDALTPAQEVDLYRLVPPDKVKEMREKKRWTWWRLVIGADGTWHAFKKED